MKENDNEIEDENNIINTNKSNNDIKIEDNNLLNIKNNSINKEKKEKKNSNDILKELDKIKLENKFICPNQDCFENCIIIIDPNTLEVNYECREHKDKMNIIDFVKQSSILKEENEKCFKCMKTYKEIKENNKKLYKCYCGKNYCEDCKSDHIKQNKNNKNEHNMIDFKIKDYSCNCNAKGKKFNSYCLTCKKNLCISCNQKHKEHIRKKFADLEQLTKDKKEQLNNKIKVQKKLIDRFNEIIDDWFLRIKKIIEIYKKKLELYNQINDIILKQYNINKNYYEAIKNIEYMRTDFDKNVNDLINSDNDFALQNSIICQILNKNNSEEYISLPKLYNKNALEELKFKNSFDLNGIINQLCELKKENLLIVNTFNKDINKNEICIYKKIEEKYKLDFSINEDNKILGLKELKDGYLLIVEEKQFKINKIKNSRIFEKQIQILTDNNEYFKDIIELFNGYLISISFSTIDKDKNKIIFWKKDLTSGNYEKLDNIIKLNKKPVILLEINTNYFAILDEQNELYIYESKNGEQFRNKIIITDSPFNVFKKAIKVNDDGILFLFEKNLILFCLSSWQIKNFNNEDNINNIFNLLNSNYFLATTSEQNYNSLKLLIIDCSNMTISKKTILLVNDNHLMEMNFILQLNNNMEIISGSIDKKIKIWEIQ